MSERKAKVQELMEARFSKTRIKHTKEGFKINKSQLDESEIRQLAIISAFCQITYVKRSGTGLVIIINLFPEDRDA